MPLSPCRGLPASNEPTMANYTSHIWTPERRKNHLEAVRKSSQDPRARANLSAALKAKWASGTRKPSPPEAYLKASETMKAAYREGRVKKRDPEEIRRSASIGGRTVTEKKREAGRRTGRLKLGVPNPPGPSAKGEENMWAKYWAFKSPRGIVLKGKNLNELIRRNPQLFLPEDTAWKKSCCRASRGLSMLCQQKPNGPTSWKGWIALPWLVADSIKQAVRDTPRPS